MVLFLIEGEMETGNKWRLHMINDNNMTTTSLRLDCMFEESQNIVLSRHLNGDQTLCSCESTS